MHGFNLVLEEPKSIKTIPLTALIQCKVLILLIICLQESLQELAQQFWSKRKMCFRLKKKKKKKKKILFCLKTCDKLENQWCMQLFQGFFFPLIFFFFSLPAEVSSLSRFCPVWNMELYFWLSLTTSTYKTISKSEHRINKVCCPKC